MILLLKIIQNTQDLILVSIFVYHAIQEEFNMDVVMKILLFRQCATLANKEL